MKKPVIAIDGYSSTGKSSISKIIAEKLGIIHLDTGALYRGVTWFALQNCTGENGSIDLNRLFASFSEIELEFRNSGGELILFLNHIDISKAIRTNEVSDQVSFVAKQKEVRDFLLQSQRSLAEKGGLIMDGRDIGTVVCPEAPVKLYVTASAEIRSQRRLKELQNRGLSATYDAVLKDMQERDLRDISRDIAPLKPASDAVILDTSDLTPEQALKQALEIVVRTLGTI